MKNVLLLCCALIFLVQCHKSDINPGEIRLLQTKSANKVTGDNEYVSFEFDQTGRIIKLLNSGDNTHFSTMAEITYNGNTAIIKFPEVHLSNADIVVEIIYTLDANNNPIQRVWNFTDEYKAPVNLPQRDFKTDTARYEYDAAGLLSRITGNRRDSLWFNPGIIHTETNYIQYTSVYTTTNGNLEKISKTTFDNSRVVEGSSTGIFSHTTEENYALAYKNSYLNRTDFTNAFILAEFDVIYMNTYPLNKHYRNIPDKIIHTTKVTNVLTGVIDENYSDTSSTAVGLNSKLLISSVNFASTPDQTLELIYK